MLRLHANTLIPDINWRKQPNWQAHSELCNRNPDTQGKVLNSNILGRVLNSTVGKWVRMQVIKQPRTKMILLSNELQTVSLANGSKSKIQSNLCYRFNSKKM